MKEANPELPNQENGQTVESDGKARYEMDQSESQLPPTSDEDNKVKPFTNGYISGSLDSRAIRRAGHSGRFGLWDPSSRKAQE